jgi:hypothetical protein
MLSNSDIYRAAHLMLHQYGDAGRMFGRGDREETLTWFRICRTIAAVRQAPAGLLH